MKRELLAAASIILALATKPAMPAEVDLSNSSSATVDVPLARVPEADERVMLRVNVDPRTLAQGSRITLSSAVDGTLIGSITPFGRPVTGQPGQFSVLVPRGVVNSDRDGTTLPLKLEFNHKVANASVRIEPEIVRLKQ
jgi:hypothetical protein